jgi:DNA polymerase-1
MRVLSLHAPDIGTFAFDLDALPGTDRKKLFDATLDGKIIIGHELGSDLSWLFGESTCRPRFIVDAALLVRQIKPTLLLQPFRLASSGPVQSRAYYAALVKSVKGQPSTSLKYLAASLSLPAFDIDDSDFASWSVSPLSAERYRHTTDRVKLITTIVQKVVPGIAFRDLPGELNRWAPWYEPFSVASMRLGEAHVRGVPLDSGYARELSRKASRELRDAVGELTQYPEFSECLKQLTNPEFGESSDVKKALIAHATKHGMVLPHPDVGVIQTDCSLLDHPQLQTLPGLILVQRIRSAKWSLRVLNEYIRSGTRDGRLHSSIGFNTVTCRTNSTAPCLQNIPRDEKWRRLIRARPGYRILAADYVAIELRIAAVLASRAIADIERRISSGEDESWFIQLCRAGLSADSFLVVPREPEKPTLKWWRQAIPAVAQRVLRGGIQRMKSAFDAGLDLHLVTAIDMASRLGKIDCRGDALNWLREKGEAEREALLETLENERQAAKACNFGLLYRMGAIGLYHAGMNNYGLKWSLEEAIEARDRWFDLFPEIRLWHFWTQYTQSQPARSACLVWNRSTSNLSEPQFAPKLYRTKTVMGRPLAILNELRQALNYQDQGTGADILARAIACLPNEIAAMLLLPVHDELVFEVPAIQIEPIRATVEKAMILAARNILGRESRIEVKTKVGDTWT